MLLYFATIFGFRLFIIIRNIVQFCILLLVICLFLLERFKPYFLCLAWKRVISILLKKSPFVYHGSKNQVWFLWVLRSLYSSFHKFRPKTVLSETKWKKVIALNLISSLPEYFLVFQYKYLSILKTRYSYLWSKIDMTYCILKNRTKLSLFLRANFLSMGCELFFFLSTCRFVF